MVTENPHPFPDPPEGIDQLIDMPDAASLALLLAMSLYLGVVGLFGFDPLQYYLGDVVQRALFILTGIAGAWQTCRQKLFG